MCEYFKPDKKFFIYINQKQHVFYTLKRTEFLVYDDGVKIFYHFYTSDIKKNFKQSISYPQSNFYWKIKLYLKDKK